MAGDLRQLRSFSESDLFCLHGGGWSHLRLWDEAVSCSRAPSQSSVGNGMGGVAVFTAVWILGNALPWYLKIQGWLEFPRLLALKDGLSNDPYKGTGANVSRVFCRFCDDIKWMTGRRPGLYWQVTWRVVSPLLLLSIFLSYIILLTQRPPSYKAWDPQYVGPSHEAVGILQVLPNIHGASHGLDDLYVVVCGLTTSGNWEIRGVNSWLSIRLEDANIPRLGLS